MGFSNAYGAVLGAFVGDASGAPLEFANNITETLVIHGMKMKGGGILNIGQGQITDDSEMAMCQLQALHKKNPHESYKTINQDLLKWYRKWASSMPFDMGTTTSSALSVEQDLDVEEHVKRITTVNHKSQSNGALMRISPLAVWTRNLPFEAKIEVLSSDTRLTHPNPNCVAASVCYSLAIHSLIKHPREVDRAIEYALSYFDATHEGIEVKSWIEEESKKPIEDIQVRHQIGYVKWAIILSFHFLRQYTPYQDAIKQTLLKGGDTDTNAAIVGGLIGALHGANTIPDYMKYPVLSFKKDDDTKIGYDRPKFLSTSKLNGLFNQLYEHSS